MSRERWVLTWFKPETGWTRVASGRSRIRAVIVLLICTLARPAEKHILRWQADELPNTTTYGVITNSTSLPDAEMWRSVQQMYSKMRPTGGPQ